MGICGSTGAPPPAPAEADSSAASGTASGNISGNASSSASSEPKAKHEGALYNKKIAAAALKLTKEIKGGSFKLTRVLLSFQQVRDGCFALAREFNRIDINNDHYVTISELRASEHFNKVAGENLESYFKEADLNEDGKFEFKEFVIFAAYCFFLSKAKSEHVKGASAEAKSEESGDIAKIAEIRSVEESKLSEKVMKGELSDQEYQTKMKRLRSTGSLLGKNNDEENIKLHKMFEIIACAWHIFDRDASGSITLDEMKDSLKKNLNHSPSNKKRHKMPKKKGGEDAASAFFSKERFLEMDANSNGNITFTEFLYTFVTWATEMDDDE